MAERKKFNFGNIDKAFSGNGMKETKAAENKFIAESGAETEQKTVVTELLDKIDKPTEVRRAFDARFIPRDKIQFHEKNDYPMEAIEELANSILEYGLISNLEVFYDEENDRYIVESGEQRTRAIDLLIERYDQTPDTESETYRNYLENVKQFAVEGYPCNVKRKRQRKNITEDKAALLDEIESETRLILANELGREKNIERTRQHIQRLNYLYLERNKLLKNEAKVNVNAEIGATLGITERQVQKYKAVDRLIPELQEIFEKKGITLNEGAGYARLSEEDQHRLLELFQAGEDKKEINALSQKLARLQDELLSGRKEIEELEQEKQNALKQIEAEKRAAEQLEEKIRNELADTNQEEIQKLNEKLETARKDMEDYKKHSQLLSKVQQNKQEELEKKLRAKEKRISENANAIRAEARMENCVKTLKSVAEELKVAMGLYKELYCDTCEKTPEEYLSEIQKIWENMC